MLQRFVERIQELRDIPDFEEFLSDELSRLGFDRFAYLAVRVPNSENAPFLLTSYPLPWITRYMQKGYVDLDPVILRSARALEPFEWSLLAREGINGRQERVMNEGAEFGVRNGATVPVHGPCGGLALLSIAASDGGRTFKRYWKEHHLHIHAMALYYHSAIEKKILQDKASRSIRLTAREREALLWTSQGKTAWETSEIMQISQDTVNFHLKNVMRKLGVYSKHHAVVKAIILGLIVPETPERERKHFKANVVNLPKLGVSQTPSISVQLQPNGVMGGCYDRGRHTRYSVSVS